MLPTKEMREIAERFYYRDALKLGRSLTKDEKDIIFRELMAFAKAYETLVCEQLEHAISH